jgi:hypothetical protein
MSVWAGESTGWDGGDARVGVGAVGSHAEPLRVSFPTWKRPNRSSSYNKYASKAKNCHKVLERPLRVTVTDDIPCSQRYVQ